MLSVLPAWHAAPAAPVPSARVCAGAAGAIITWRPSSDEVGYDTVTGASGAAGA
jgi:hypothetical protein